MSGICPQAFASSLRCLAVFAIAARTAVAMESVVVPSGNLERGRIVFAEKGCRVCHAVRGVGGTRGPDLAEALVNRGLFGIAAGMWSHLPNMRKMMQREGTEYPSLSVAEVRDILSYLAFVGFIPEPGNASEGQRVFNSKGCAKCHVADSSGRSRGPPLEGPLQRLSAIAIAQQMWNHQARMVSEMAKLGMAAPTFEGEEMANLLAFLRRSDPGAATTPASLGDPASGRRLFVSKRCAGCHLPTPEGTSIGPDLSTVSWYKTSTAMAAAMWNHGPAMAAAAKKLEIALPRFQGNEMTDILAYLYLLRSIEQVGDAERGEAVFAVKHCASCHDGHTAPDLTRNPLLQSPAQIASAMWNHAPKMEEAVQLRGLEWPTLTSADVADLLAFLSARNQQQAPPERAPRRIGPPSRAQSPSSIPAATQPDQ
jgi:cytochrome c2